MDRLPVLTIHHDRQLGLSPDGSRQESTTVYIKVHYEILTSGLLKQLSGNQWRVLTAIALHARLLAGEELAELIRLGLATPADEGGLVAYVSDTALANELGLRRQTVSELTEQLADLMQSGADRQSGGLIEIRALPKGVQPRGAGGCYRSNRFFVLRDPNVIHLSKFQTEDGVRKPSTVEPLPRTLSRCTENAHVRFSAGVQPYTNNTDTDTPQQEGAIVGQVAFVLDVARAVLPGWLPAQRDDQTVRELLAEGYAADEISLVITAAAQRPGIDVGRIRGLRFFAPIVRQRPPGQWPRQWADLPAEEQTWLASLEPAYQTLTSQPLRLLDGLDLVNLARQYGLPAVQAALETANRASSAPVRHVSRYVARTLSEAEQTASQQPPDTATSPDPLHEHIAQRLSAEKFGPVTPAIQQAIAELLAHGFGVVDLGDQAQDWWDAAINRAAMIGRRRFSTVQTILERWRVHGFGTEPSEWSDTAMTQAPQPPACQEDPGGEQTGEQRLWRKALEQLQLQVAAADYAAWLRDTTVAAGSDGRWVIEASPAACEWLENRLGNLIRKTLVGLLGETVDVSFKARPAEVR